MSDYTPLKGTKDLFPDDHKYLTFLKKVFRHEFRKNGFRRITTSVLESNEIIGDVFGENTGGIYKTEDGCLRSHSAVGILRAYLNAEMSEEIQPVYYYFMDNYFSNGEMGYNELEKIGGEIIGENDPILDAILIYITYSILNKIGLENDFTIRINSIGIEKEKVKYREELISFYENKKHLLSEKSLALLESDPMLLLLSTEENEEILAKEAPAMTKLLKKDSKAHYASFKEYLDLLKIPYIEDHTLVGKFDFNTHNVWDFRVKGTHEQIALGARHNKLSTKLGTLKEIPATGFFTNTNVIVKMLKDKNIKIKNKDSIDLYFVQLGDEAKKAILPLSLQARDAGINTVVSLGTPSMREQMLKANRSGSKYVVMVGIMEARNGIFQVRDTIAGTQEEVNRDDLINYIIDKVGIKSLDFYCPAKDLINE
ncbi:hypothetical protein A9Q91_01515 [Candidatus Gracilibacteria bacterium 28_42_T64]|nr:hypothetical protein A9Q91_01515 [Candidatus Gracilibacteria bacterium 28_42_T64]